MLITAAAGGTGQLAVQLAVLAGCRVIGTCSGGDKAEILRYVRRRTRAAGLGGTQQGAASWEARPGVLLPRCSSPVTLRLPGSPLPTPLAPLPPCRRSLGCHRVVNYKAEDLKAVLKAECPRGLDVVYESGAARATAGGAGAGAACTGSCRCSLGTAAAAAAAAASCRWLPCVARRWLWGWGKQHHSVLPQLCPAPPLHPTPLQSAARCLTSPSTRWRPAAA